MTRTERVLIADFIGFCIWIIWIAASFGLIGLSSSVLVFLLVSYLLIQISFLKTFKMPNKDRVKTFGENLYNYTTFAIILVALFGKLIFWYYLILFWVLLILSVYIMRPDLINKDN